MFSIDDLKKTRFAQELINKSKAKGKIEGKLEVILSLLKKGFSVAEIAEVLGLEIEQVRQTIAKLN